MATDLEKALGLVGEATVSGSDWTFALDALAEAVKAVGIIIVPAKPAEVPGRLKQSRSMETSTEEYVKGGWYEYDERSIRGWNLARQKRVILEQDITTREERARHPFYQDFLRKFDLEWFAAAPCETDISWALSLQRTSRDGPFSKEEAKRIAQIGLHIRAFLRLEEQLELAQRRTLLEAYELIGRRAVLLGMQQRVLGMTRTAEADIVGTISYRGGRLAARDKLSDDRLQKLLLRVTSKEPLGERHGRVPVRKPDGGVLIVEALPLPHNAVGPHARAIVIITDPYNAREVDADLLTQTFRLTPAQRRLAQALFEGGSAKDAAERLSLSHETVRGQLGELFDKTETNRQADLLRLFERFSREG